MSFLDSLFGSSDEGDASAGDASAGDPLGDLSLDKLREGYLVDYDLKTWTVATHARYDYEGFPSDAWTLRADDETRFLEYEDDDGPVFTLCRAVEVADLKAEGEAGALLPQIEERGEPPATLVYEGDTYELDERGPATRIVGDDRQRLRYWDYEGATGAAAEEGRFVSFERFGESDWNAYAGREVEPYEFDNILPSA